MYQDREDGDTGPAGEGRYRFDCEDFTYGLRNYILNKGHLPEGAEMGVTIIGPYGPIVPDETSTRHALLWVQYGGKYYWAEAQSEEAGGPFDSRDEAIADMLKQHKLGPTVDSQGNPIPYNHKDIVGRYPYKLFYEVDDLLEHFKNGMRTHTKDPGFDATPYLPPKDANGGPTGVLSFPGPNVR